MRRSTRVKKPVERLVNEKAEEKVNPILPGAGVALADHPRVIENLKAYTGASDELKAIHKILLGTEGRKQMIKKDLAQFCGIAHIKGEEEAKAVCKNRVGRVKTSALLRLYMKILDIERGADSFHLEKGKSPTRANLEDRFVEWLLLPKPSGKRVAVKAKRAKRAAEAPAAEEPPKKKRARKASKKAKEELEIGGLKISVLEKAVDDILKTVDKGLLQLNEADIGAEAFTMKAMRAELSERFGDVIKENKDWIKEVVTERLNQ